MAEKKAAAGAPAGELVPQRPTSPERPWPTNVVQAIARVMEEMPGVGKDAEYSGGGTQYRYRSIEGVTAAAQRLLGRYGVVFVPRVVERPAPLQFPVNGKPWTQEELTITYTIYGPGGVDDCITVGPLHTLGRDNSDKGTNKAMTQAFKQALQQVLCIGDGKDDADSERIEGDAHAGPAAPRPAKTDGWEDATQEFEAHRALQARLTALAEDDSARAAARALRSEHGWPVSVERFKELVGLVDESEQRIAAAAAEAAATPPDAESVDKTAETPSTHEASTETPTAALDAPSAPTAPAGAVGAADETPKESDLAWATFPDENAKDAEPAPAELPPVLTPDEQALVDHVNSFDTVQLTSELQARDLSPNGSTKVRRQRLAKRLLTEGWSPPAD